MLDIIFLIYNVLALGLPVFLAGFLMYKYAKKKDISFPKRKMTLIAIFAIYLFLVISVTGAGSIYDIGKYENLIRPGEITLLPFTSGGTNYMTYILNVIMFMPLGFLVPLIWDKARNFWYIFVTGFGFSFLIECSQLLNRRNSALDDILMNTLGAIIGYGILLLFLKLIKKPLKIGQQIFKYEPFIYIGAVFFGNFFLYNVYLLYGIFS